MDKIPMTLTGSSANGTVRHIVVKTEDGKRVAKCNPRSRMTDIDRGQPTCPRCNGK